MGEPATPEAAAMSDLGVLLCLGLLLVGGLRHLLQVRVLDPVHQLDVLLQHQPLGEGAPGVGAVPAEHRETGLLRGSAAPEGHATNLPPTAHTPPGGCAATRGSEQSEHAALHRGSRVLGTFFLACL